MLYREKMLNLAPKRQLAAMMFAKGMGYRKVSSELKLSVYTVKDWSEQFKAGYFRVKLPANLLGYSEEIKSRVIRMHENGMSAYRISALLGISHSTCLRWIKMNKSKPTVPVQKTK